MHIDKTYYVFIYLYIYRERERQRDEQIHIVYRESYRPLYTPKVILISYSITYSTIWYRLIFICMSTTKCTHYIDIYIYIYVDNLLDIGLVTEWVYLRAQDEIGQPFRMSLRFVSDLWFLQKHTQTIHTSNSTYVLSKNPRVEKVCRF